MKTQETTEKKVTATVAKGIIGKAIKDGYEEKPAGAKLYADEVKLGTEYFKQGRKLKRQAMPNRLVLNTIER